MRYFVIMLFWGLLAQPALAVGYKDVTIFTSPEYPKPGEALSATLQSYAYNLQGVTISWLLNGVLLQEGAGLTKVAINTPSLGEAAHLVVKVGSSTLAESIITPTFIDLLWEAQTYVPKGYQGRPLPVDASQVTALAVPHLGTTTDSTALTYTWYKDGRQLTNLSGAGKEAITTEAPSLYDDYNLSVEVTDVRGVTLGRSGVHISAVEPEVVLYTAPPLGGISFFNALTRASSYAQGIESSFVAMPYYYSILSPQDLVYSWNISGSTQQLPSSRSNSIIVTKTPPQTTLSVSVRHPEHLLQSATALYRFGNTQRSTSSSGNEDETYQSPFGSANASQ